MAYSAVQIISGKATLVAGVVTVSNTLIKTTSVISLTVLDGGGGTIGQPRIVALSNGSFQIKSYNMAAGSFNNSDTSTIHYVVIL